MKKLILCTMALALLLCACATPAGTSSQADVSSAANEAPAEPRVTVNTAATASIGKALTDLKTENPTYVYGELGGPDCYYGGLCDADKKYAYLFFGAQDGLTMEEAAQEHGDQLYSSGIYTTIGDYFPSLKETPLAIDDFITALELKDEDVSYWFGWVSFRYNGFDFHIHAGSGNADDVNAKPVEAIGANMVLIITSPMQMEMNGNILHY